MQSIRSAMRRGISCFELRIVQLIISPALQKAGFFLLLKIGRSREHLICAGFSAGTALHLFSNQDNGQFNITNITQVRAAV